MANIEEELELQEPCPDIHALFIHYNQTYFDNELGACFVEWSSKRMTLCGGVCEFLPGGGCCIKLSQPLLSLRPARDLKATLLHEMIHAIVMLKYGGERDDPGGHGTLFNTIRRKINASTVPDSQRPHGGYCITVTHDWFAEVDHFRQHWWRCKRCSSLVKRAMNRRPQEADCRSRRGAACNDPNCRWHVHLRTCGGEFEKIKEPEGFGQKRVDTATGSRQETRVIAVHAKRRRQEGRPITDFFPRQAQQSVESDVKVHDALPSLAAVQRQQQDGKQQDEQHQVVEGHKCNSIAADAATEVMPTQPTAEQRRRLAAEAAAKRMLLNGAAQAEGAGAMCAHVTGDRDDCTRDAQQDHNQLLQQHLLQTEVLSAAPDSVGLCSSMIGRADDVEMPSSNDESQLPLLAAGPSKHASPSPVTEAGAAGVQEPCPVCGKHWPSEVSMAAVNTHLDECLTLAALTTQPQTAALLPTVPNTLC